LNKRHDVIYITFNTFSTHSYEISSFSDLDTAEECHLSYW